MLGDHSDTALELEPLQVHTGTIYLVVSRVVKISQQMADITCYSEFSA